MNPRQTEMEFRVFRNILTNTSFPHYFKIFLKKFSNWKSSYLIFFRSFPRCAEFTRSLMVSKIVFSRKCALASLTRPLTSMRCSYVSQHISSIGILSSAYKTRVRHFPSWNPVVWALTCSAKFAQMVLNRSLLYPRGDGHVTNFNWKLVNPLVLLF